MTKRAVIEHRAAFEMRAAGRRLEGYAAVFASPARIGRFTETVARGAFAASLAAGGDVLALVDHDAKALLGRTASGTLRLMEDTRGLHFEISVPDTQLGRDVLALAERGDLGGASIGFRVLAEAWPAQDRRELRAVELVEVSVIHAHAAYAETSVTARSRASRANTEARARRALVGRL